jgi:hypothetical protein
VQKCKIANNGVRIFGNEKCWFIHNNNMKSSENMNNENYENTNNIKDKENTNNENSVIKKMMNIMETFTEWTLRLKEI